MSTNQKYSGRVHSRRQLISVQSHLVAATNQLNTIGQRYAGVLPQVSSGCVEMIKMLDMIKAMVNDLRDNI